MDLVTLEKTTLSTEIYIKDQGIAHLVSSQESLTSQ